MLKSIYNGLCKTDPLTHLSLINDTTLYYFYIVYFREYVYCVFLHLSGGL